MININIPLKIDPHEPDKPADNKVIPNNILGLISTITTIIVLTRKMIE